MIQKNASPRRCKLHNLHCGIKYEEKIKKGDAEHQEFRRLRYSEEYEILMRFEPCQLPANWNPNYR